MRKAKKPKKEPSKELQYLGERISEARNTSGLTQQGLAEQCHRGLRHIQNIEGGLVNPSYEVLSDLVHRLGMSANILFFPDMPQVEAEVQHLLCKFAACTEDERQIILNTLDCLAEQFLRRHPELPAGARTFLFLLALFYTVTNKRKIDGKIPARIWKDFLSVSTKREGRCIVAAASHRLSNLFFARNKLITYAP